MQAIDFGDTLTFRRASMDALCSSAANIPLDGSNLILKATALFRKKTGLDAFVDIALEKRIPTEAGLGGGSSNAATTLWALNELYGAGASLAELMKWGAELGSDVPFFLSKGTAYCTGRGEVVRNLDPFTSEQFYIAKLDEGLSTPKVFSRVKRFEKRCLDTVLDTFESHAPCYFNDLEEPAFSVQPKLLEFRDSLLSLGFDTVRMTGSGSAFFCLGCCSDDAVKASGLFRVSAMNRDEKEWY